MKISQWARQNFCSFRAHSYAARAYATNLRGVGEQRKTEERDCRCFARAKNGTTAKDRQSRFWASDNHSGIRLRENYVI